MRFQPANPPSSPNPPAKPSPSAREGLSSGTRELSAHRQAAVRWGFNVADVQDAIQTAVGGNAVSQVLQGEARYDRMLRYQKPYRDTRKAIENVRLLSPSGERASLAQLTKVDNNDGAEDIYREGQQRYIVVKYSVRGRDLGPVFQYRISFSTTTTWQAYADENTMSYFSQMVGLCTQNSLPGLALPLYEALRGYPAQLSEISGVDLTRSLLWILLPGALLGSSREETMKPRQFLMPYLQLANADIHHTL